MVVLFIPINRKLIEIARTEVIYDNPNPQFVKFFEANYIFETIQPLHFKIYDVDSEKANLSKHDYIGYVDTDIQHLIMNQNTQVVLQIQLDKKENRGELILVTENSKVINEVISATVSASDLKKVRTFARNCPFFTLFKPSESGSWLPTYRSEVISKRSTCQFKRFTIPTQNLCNGDFESPIVIHFQNFQEKKKRQEIVNAQISLREITEQSRIIQWTNENIKTLELLCLQTFKLKIFNLFLNISELVYNYT
jgi:hypothetical protein